MEECYFLIVALFNGCFSCFLICTNNIKSCNASHIIQLLYIIYIYNKICILHIIKIKIIYIYNKMLRYRCLNCEPRIVFVDRNSLIFIEYKALLSYMKLCFSLTFHMKALFQIPYYPGKCSSYLLILNLVSLLAISCWRKSNLFL